MPGINTLGNLLKIGLTAKEVIEMLKIMEGAAPSQQLLQLWAKTGLVRPSVLSSGVRGRWNLSLYSWSDFASLRLVMRLRREGVTMLRVKYIFQYCRQQLVEALVQGSSSSIVVDRSGRAYVVTKDSEIEVPSGQVRLRFELGQFATGNLAVRDQVRLAA